MQLSCHQDSLNYSRLLSWHLKCDLMISNGRCVCTHESEWGSFSWWLYPWEMWTWELVTSTYWHTGSLWLLESRYVIFHGGISICFHLTNASDNCFQCVFFTPIDALNYLLQKVWGVFLFWKMSNNNRLGGWAGHTSPHQPHLSAGRWYSRYQA